jgi:hypothetical protein
MIIQKKATYSLVFALAILFLAMFAKVIPCQTAPSVPNPDFSWDFCSLNPDTNNQQGVERLFFGSSDSMRQSYFITLVISFAIAFIALQFLTKNSH